MEWVHMAKHGGPYCSVSSRWTKLSIPRSGAPTLQFSIKANVCEWLNNAVSDVMDFPRVLQIIQHIQAMHIVPLFYVVENSFALLIIILQKSYLPFSIYIYYLPYITTLRCIKQIQTELWWNFDPCVWIYITHWSVKTIILCLTFMGYN